MKYNSKSTSKGFTLIELIVVIAVIGILATISVIGFGRYQSDARDARRYASITVIAEALEKYYDINGEYPSCSAVSAAGTTVLQTTLKGINQSTLIAPQASSSDTNSIKCTSSGSILTSGGVDFFEYQGDGSADCNGSGSCLQFTLKYKDESSGTVKAISSRRQVNLATSSAPVLSISPTAVSQVNLTWTSVNNAASYTVQYANDNGFTISPVVQSVGTTSLSISGLITGKTYYFRVQAINGSSTTNWSNTVSLVANFTSLTWSQRTSSGLRNWNSVTSSADGTKLMATTYTASDYPYTSADSGATWTQRTSAGSNNWNGTASSADGTKLVIGGFPGYLFTSADSGATWTQRTSAGSRGWYSIASSADGTKLVAGDANPGYLYTSTDSGATWTQRTSVGSRGWFNLASSADGTKLAVNAGSNFGGGNYIYTSTDSGVTWLKNSMVASSGPTLSSDGTTLVISGADGYIYTSVNFGVTWTKQTSSGSRTWNNFASSSDGTKLVAENNPGYLYTSIDSGVTWTPNTGYGSQYWEGLASSADGTKIATGPSYGYIYTGVYGP